MPPLSHKKAFSESLKIPLSQGESAAFGVGTDQCGQNGLGTVA